MSAHNSPSPQHLPQYPHYCASYPLTRRPNAPHSIHHTLAGPFRCLSYSLTLRHLIQPSFPLSLCCHSSIHCPLNHLHPPPPPNTFSRDSCKMSIKLHPSVACSPQLLSLFPMHYNQFLPPCPGNGFLFPHCCSNPIRDLRSLFLACLIPSLTPCPTRVRAQLRGPTGVGLPHFLSTKCPSHSGPPLQVSNGSNGPCHDMRTALPQLFSSLIDPAFVVTEGLFPHFQPQ